MHGLMDGLTEQRQLFSGYKDGRIGAVCFGITLIRVLCLSIPYASASVSFVQE